MILTVSFLLTLITTIFVLYYNLSGKYKELSHFSKETFCTFIGLAYVLIIFFGFGLGAIHIDKTVKIPLSQEQYETIKSQHFIEFIYYNKQSKEIKLEVKDGLVFDNPSSVNVYYCEDINEYNGVLEKYLTWEKK